MKTCLGCNISKPFDMFWKHSLRKLKLFERCKSCMKASRRDFKENNYDLYLERERRCKLKSTFGLTPEQYDDLLKQQEHKCAICKKENTYKRRFAVDHCHKTDVIRGLLCMGCNTGIGSMKEDIQALLNAVDYLSTPYAVAMRAKKGKK